MIDAEHLTKYYGRRAAVRDVNFHVEKGEIVGLLGPNGAGKTTTMRMLTGYLPMSSGKARVAGFDVSEKPMEVRKRLGYLPETVPLYTDMTVSSYLAFTAKLRGVPPKARSRRIEEVMEMCRVTEVSDRVIAKLSRGYRQRVGLAQAIIHNPDVIILDEPTVGLDPRQIVETRQVIRDLAGSHSMILSTHILPEVSTLCDRVIIINRGRVLVDDSLANLQKQSEDNSRLQVLVRGPLAEIESTLRSLPGMTTVIQIDDEGQPIETESEETAPLEVNRLLLEAETGLDLREQVARIILDNSWGLKELKSNSPTLEEIFVKLVSSDSVEDDDVQLATPLVEYPERTGTVGKLRRYSEDDELDYVAEDEPQETEEPVEVVSQSKGKSAPAFLTEDDKEK